MSLVFSVVEQKWSNRAKFMPRHGVRRLWEICKDWGLILYYEF